jgi:hypothetical protein
MPLLGEEAEVILNKKNSFVPPSLLGGYDS